MGQKGCILNRENLNIQPDCVEELYLLHWAQKAQESLWDETNRILTEKAVQLFLSGLFQQLKIIAEKSFESAKCSYLSEESPLLGLDFKLAGKVQREEVSKRLLSELEETEGRVIFNRVPLLKEWLDKKTDVFINASKVLFKRLGEDRKEIRDYFFHGEDYGKVMEICFDNADIHFHGQSTCIVKTEKGSFVYKPHDCSIDVWFYEVVSGGFSDYLKVPKCLKQDGYGYCEFINFAPVQSADGVRRYYRRLGGACALFHALGSSDLHSENWICSGEYPAVVDLETVLTPAEESIHDNSAQSERIFLKEGFLYDVKRSLIPSCILPHRKGRQELSVLLDDSDGSCCMPVADGRKYTVKGFEEDFLDGFSEGYDKCREQKDSLREAIGRCRDIPIRKLMRDTGFYAILQKKLYSVPALQSEDGLRKVLAHLELFFHEYKAEHRKSITCWEKSCLLEGDIPYFSSTGGGHNLMGYGNILVENFFKVSASDHALERLERMSEREKSFEQGILIQSIGRAILPAGLPKRENPDLLQYTPLEKREALAEAEELFRHEERLALMFPNGKTSWLAMSEKGNLTWAKPVLAKGTAGMGVFFSALASVSRDQEIVRKAADFAWICLEQIEEAVSWLEQETLIQERVLPFGIAEGLGGVLLSLTLMGQYLENSFPGRISEKVTGLIDKMDIENAEEMDVYSGTAGTLLALCKNFQLSKSPRTAVYIRRFADRLLAQRSLMAKDGLLLWDTLKKGRPISGAGHGMAGIAAALLSAAEILGEKKYSEAAEMALEFENKIYSEKLKTWPDLRNSSLAVSSMHGLCSGAPGIGLALLKCRQQGCFLSQEVLRKIEGDIEKAAKCCLEHEPLFRDHFCCGNSSAVEFLLTLPESKSRSYAGRLLAFMRERKNQNGSFNMLLPNFRQVAVLDLFYGNAGVGYELLRYAEQEKIIPIIF